MPVSSTDQLYVQSTPSARFGVKIQLNESSFVLGADDTSVTLTILLTDTVFTFMKYHGE